MPNNPQLYKKGHIIWFDFPLPTKGERADHPGLILSNQSVYDQDSCYICAMLSTSPKVDRFTFKLDKSMIESGYLDMETQVRYHLIMYVLENEIDTSKKPKARLRPRTMEKIHARISETVFGDS